MVEYANATVAVCPQAVNCKYWGETLHTPSGIACCNRRHPGVNAQHYEDLKERKKE